MVERSRSAAGLPGPPAFPFSAVAGMEIAKQALLLLAVDPELKGVLIAGGPGTAKTILARAFPSLLPGAEQRPFVEMPLGATEEGLLGCLHWERALRTGAREIVDGLLARAHGGTLYVDEANLLPRGIAREIGNALQEGCLRVERDGLSATCPTRFVLIGSYDPNEGEVSPVMGDAVGIHVTVRTSLPVEERVEILRRVAAYHMDPEAFIESQAAQTALLKARIASGRSRLGQVELSEKDLLWLSQTAARFGIESHRADIFAARLARARAALMGRHAVHQDDLETAVELALLPRAGQCASRNMRTPSPQPECSPSEGWAGPPATGIHSPAVETDGLILPPADGSLPPNVWGLPVKASARAGRGRGAAQTNSRACGRYVRAATGPSSCGRVAIEATLRAAAPHQLTLRNPSPDNQDELRIVVREEHLRWKQFKRPASILVIFAVDASGSMAMNRIRQAKGAVLKLLAEAHRRRDKVALISFRGSGAEVLLPPSRSTDFAKRVLAKAPVGGGTPLASGIRACLELARRARLGDLPDSLLVLITDGGANTTLRGMPCSRPEEVWEELDAVCGAVRLEGVASVVIDTSHRHISGGKGERLAHMLGGRYLSLPRPDTEAVYETVVALKESLRDR